MTLLPEPRFVKDLVAATSRPVALTVAGFDPSSGAGATADLKVFAAHGVYGVAAITALTIQSTLGVRGMSPVSGRLVRETLECLAGDVGIAGVKIGMLGTAEVAQSVADWLCAAGIPRERVVLDPVLRSSSGAALLEAEGLEIMRRELLPVVGWVTPNIDELAVLTGEAVSGPEMVPALACKLAKEGKERGTHGDSVTTADSGLHVVVTGGHLDPPDDFLRTASGEETWFPGWRVETASTHGTGCAFSSALLCRVMAGDAAVEAVRGAKEFVLRALESAVPVGRGKGPVLSGI